MSLASTVYRNPLILCVFRGSPGGPLPSILAKRSKSFEAERSAASSEPNDLLSSKRCPSWSNRALGFSGIAPTHRLRLRVRAIRGLKSAGREDPGRGRANGQRLDGALGAESPDESPS